MDNITLERNDNELSHFALMINKLRSLPGENILIVDNVNSSVYAEISLLPTDNWNILLTSKEHIENENIHSYRLGHLAEEDAIALFKKHCKKKAEPKELKEFMSIINYHALFLELTAKTNSESYEIDSLHDFLDKLKSNINHPSLGYKIRIAHSKNKEIEFSNYILKIFSMGHLFL